LIVDGADHDVLYPILSESVQGQYLLCSKTGFTDIALRRLQKGNIICVIVSANLPLLLLLLLLLRPASHEFLFVSQSYVYSLKNGEARKKAPLEHGHKDQSWLVV
jgi:hypothetical protein